MTLGFLLGNSSLRHCAFERRAAIGSFRSVGRVAWSELEARIDALAASFSAHDGAVVVASVRDDLVPLLERLLRPGRQLLLAGRDVPVPIENGYERPEEVGIDRLLNAVAAFRRSGDRGAVVLDFGTVLSVSVVSPGGAFLGGAIALGANSAKAGLGARAPRLPVIEPRRPPTALGRTTEAGIEAGLYWQIGGGAAEILRQLLCDLKFSPRVYATGGDAPLFSPAIAEIDAVVPELTLEGLQIAYQDQTGATHGA